MLARKIIPQEISEVLSYCPETGELRWLVKAGKKVNKGDIAGTISKAGYRRAVFKGKKYFAHRLAWFLHYGEQPPKILDHINGDRTDNRIANLRSIDQLGNCMNKIGHHGVCWHKPTRGRKGYWMTQFRKKYLYCGPDLFEAWCRRKSAENKYWASHQNPTAASIGVQVS